MKENKTIPVNIEDVEKRTRDWINKKYDLLGVKKDKKLRDQLYEIDMAIFMNMHLFRTFNFYDISERLNNAFNKIFFEIIMERLDGK